MVSVFVLALYRMPIHVTWAIFQRMHRISETQNTKLHNNQKKKKIPQNFLREREKNGKFALKFRPKKRSKKTFSKRWLLL